ncbi:hypothetical protein L2E82_15755 [Cichorium intybus]|uniref:Uncharacterized protein n=1 Tax=Cichorium intybus TaxID=13427 RepID=A0ACB9F300_CICIN|nr:hypothetical protein L2E82_15755 [Cichorium intybus]
MGYHQSNDLKEKRNTTPYDIFRVYFNVLRTQTQPYRYIITTTTIRVFLTLFLLILLPPSTNFSVYTSTITVRLSADCLN